VHKIWRPQKQNANILDRAWAHVQSVAYAVGLRWLFYRLLQDGLYTGKGDYHNKMVPLFSDARKAFHGPWRPNTLADETREMEIGGGGYDGADDWYEVLAERLGVSFDKWATQSYYLTIMYEAKAMSGQFRQYAPGISLVPFGGDPSVDYKWRVAQHLSAKAEKYDTPVKVFYFGDRDEKGEMIDQSALEDIQDWCDVPFEFERVGLTLAQARRMGVPENPDKPGEYQWEALTDAQAESLIRPVTDLVDRNAWKAVEAEEEEAAQVVRNLIRGNLLPAVG